MRGSSTCCGKRRAKTDSSAPRPFKPALDHAQACEIILHGDERIDSRGNFDPRLVEALSDTHAQFDAIWRAFLGSGTNS
jgi:HD-GYP domain-containing protein (c-di-GMP phosphodiesterase class II)